MKNKQKPVILGSIVVVALIGIVLTNSTPIWAQIFSEKPKEQKPKDTGTAKALTDKDKAELASQVAGNTRKNVAMVEEGAEKPTTIPEEPSIIIKKPEYMKQIVNSTAVQPLWYKEESKNTDDVEKLNKSKGN